MKRILYSIIFVLLFISQQMYAQWENTGTVTADSVSVVWKPSMDISMRLDLSDLYIKPDQSVEIIPLLQGSKDTVQLPRILVNGRVRHLIYKREGEAGYADYLRVVRRHNGTAQYIDYSTWVVAEKWMDGANLALITDLCGCGWRSLADKQMTLAEVKAPKYEPLLTYIAPMKEEVKTREKSGRAYLDFPVNKTNIYPDYRNNPLELWKIRATIDSVRTDPYATITEVSIKGYASPEGSYSNNARLAQGRAATLSEYVRNLYHFDGVRFTVMSEPEDWQGLEERIMASVLPDKEELLAIIRNPRLADPDEREQVLKRLNKGEPYRYLLQNIYPALRHSDYVVKYTIRNFTVEEAKVLLYTDPRQLSLDEMYRVAKTYETGSKEFNAVFEISVRLYPDDPVSNLNAANTALLRKDPVAAAGYLQKAAPGKEKELAETALKELEKYLKETEQ